MKFFIDTILPTLLIIITGVSCYAIGLREGKQVIKQSPVPTVGEYIIHLEGKIGKRHGISAKDLRGLEATAASLADELSN